MGGGGTGQLAITNGGMATSNTAHIADLLGSTGSAIVRGAGSTWINSGVLQVGGGFQDATGGNGALTIIWPPG